MRGIVTRTVRSGARRDGASGRPAYGVGRGEAGAVAKVFADEPDRDGAFADRCRRRFTEPLRTSPAANTPGALVSSRWPCAAQSVPATS